MSSPLAPISRSTVLTDAHGPVLRPWERADDDRVAAFVDRHAEGLVYYGPAFRRYLLAIVGGTCRSQLAFEHGELTGVLPLLEKDGPYGRVLNSLPFFGSNGGALAVTEASRAALQAEYERAAATAASAVWIPQPFVEAPQPPATLTDERIAQWTPLDPAYPEALWTRVDASARRNVQKAVASGVTVRETDQGLAFLEAVHRENMAAIGGRAKPREFFSALPDTMAFGRDWRLYLAEQHGTPLAALLTFEASKTVEYVTPVVLEAARGVQPTAAILSHAMIDAARRGFTRWNWGGTWVTQEGVYRFKRKWGATERRYHYSVSVNDQTLLDRSAADLTAGYPWYYTVPFGALRSTR